MSKYLIIFANPNHEGHGGYILKKLKEQLTKSGDSFLVLDLYQEKYDPNLKLEEIGNGSNKILNPDTLAYQKQIRNADKLIFIYPVWWQNMPAILKGFLDRTITSGFAFKYVIGVPRPLLKGKKAAVFCTTASPYIYNFIFKHNRATNILCRDILNFCGIKNQCFHLGGARKLNNNMAKLDKIADRIIKYLN